MLQRKAACLIIACIFLLTACSLASAQDIEPQGAAIASDKQGNKIYQVSVNGIKVGYKLIGSGEPLLMIVGLGFTIDNWPQKLIDELSGKYQLIIPDNRGMGHSTANQEKFTYKLFSEDMLGLLDILKVKKAHVLGFSMGSVVAQELLLQNPGRINKAIIYATSTDGSNVAAALEGRTLDNPIVSRQVEATTHWKTPMGKLAAVNNQVMFVVGTSDTVVGVESSKKLVSALNGAWLAQFKGATHLLMDEAPVELAKTVILFLGINETVVKK